MKHFYIVVAQLTAGASVTIQETEEPADLYGRPDVVYLGSEDGVFSCDEARTPIDKLDQLTAPTFETLKGLPGPLVPLPDVDGRPMPILNVDNIDYVLQDSGRTKVGFHNRTDLDIPMPFRAVKEALCGPDEADTDA